MRRALLLALGVYTTVFLAACSLVYVSGSDNKIDTKRENDIEVDAEVLDEKID